ncbi:MAG: response regulator [Alphaproteobacteria bacterium]|nr:response regulator [Alphaproteobacteria bacterium]
MSVEMALGDTIEAGLPARLQRAGEAREHGPTVWLRRIVFASGILAAAVAAVAAVWLASAQSVFYLVGLVGLGIIALLAVTLGFGTVGAERRLQAMALPALDALPEPMVLTSRSGRLLHANAAARAAFGWGADLPRGVDSLFESEGPSGAALFRLLQAARRAVEAHEGLRLRGREETHVGVSVWPAGPGGRQLLWRVIAFDPSDAEAPPAAAPAPAEAPAPKSLGDAWGTFLEAAPIGMVRIAGDGAVRAANAVFQKLADEPRSFGSLVGRAFLDVFIPKDRPQVQSFVDGLAAGREVEPVEARLAGTAKRIVELHPLRLGEGALGAQGAPETLVYVLDVTERDQMRQAHKMQAIGQLAGGVAHDFNNLLTAIIGFCDLLLLRHGVGDPSFGDVNQIRQNATRAANLTGQLLAFSRQQSLVPRVLDLKDVLSDLSQLLRRLLGERIELAVQHQRDLWLVKVDKVQFEQVIMNLAVNSRDAMPNGGALTIRTENIDAERSVALGQPLMPPADYVMISVSDTGCGIPADDLDKIFEPFFTTKPVGEGTGLGLSTVYGIVKQTGGFIFPESEVGKGTTFRIYLPRHVAKASEAIEAAAEVSPDHPDLTGQETILLVEDEDAVRTFAARALESRGYRVLSADDGEAALEEMEKANGSIDLVISDVKMPTMDGPTLVQKVRERYPEVHVVFISGYAEEAFRDQLAEGGNFEFLPKPFTLKQLAAKVKTVLSER